MHDIEFFLILFFVCSQLGVGLGSYVVSLWGKRCLQKVGYKNKFSFP
jgi:hypothetical protein